MARESLAQRLNTLSAKPALTEDECREIAQMRAARELRLAPGVKLPDAAFATPGKTLFLTLERVALTARHLRDLANWPSLVQMHIQTCRVDESALGVLAAAKKLTDLWLEETNVTDAGLVEVGKITKLRWLTLGGTNVTDAGLAHLKDLHDLRTLWLDRTAITDAGLMQLAHLTRLTALNTKGSKITDAGREAFFNAQQANLKSARNAARKTPPAPAPAHDPAALEAATNVFLDFSRAMAKWEADCMAASTRDDVSTMTEQQVLARRAEQQAVCQAIFDRYCTPLPRKYGRPNVVHFGEPSHYDARQQQIDSVEFDTPRRIYITVTHKAYGKYRYTLVKKATGWRVDNAQTWIGGWQSHGL
jgi:hypothetical protein